MVRAVRRGGASVTWAGGPAGPGGGLAVPGNGRDTRPHRGPTCWLSGWLVTVTSFLGHINWLIIVRLAYHYMGDPFPAISKLTSDLRSQHSFSREQGIAQGALVVGPLLLLSCRFQFLRRSLMGKGEVLVVGSYPIRL